MLEQVSWKNCTPWKSDPCWSILWITVSHGMDSERKVHGELSLVGGNPHWRRGRTVLSSQREKLDELTITPIPRFPAPLGKGDTAGQEEVGGNVFLRVMRELVEEPTQLLFVIYHQSWLTGGVPEEWKLSSVMPIHKKDQEEDPGNYIPDSKISLTLMPDKVMEQIILKVITHHVQDSQGIRSTQQGFRKGRTVPNLSGLRTWEGTGGLHRGPTPLRPALHISFSPNAIGDGAVEHSDNPQEETFFKFVIPPLLYTVCSFSRIWAEIPRGADETPDPGRGNPEWCGEWEDMGQLLKEFSDPVVWDFPREQIQNPVELGKYLKERYHDGSKGEKMAAVSWALAYAYRTLLETVGQQTEAGGKGYKSTATPVTQATVNTPVVKPAARLEPEPELAAKADRGSQDFTLVEADVSLTGKEWEKHPIVTGPEAPCILGIDYLRSGYFKDPKGFRRAFGIAAVVTEGIQQLNALPGLSENPSAVGLLKVQEQRVPIATSIVHRRQYRTTRDAVIPIHKIIQELESQEVVSKTHSPFNSPI
ncbi:hypothetical protein DUI87_03827 [Hirundo rustica rustica]|uniref:Reverse transcriptase domain-containing protein n=1 Tax=Hirundo rustica rustica TaxID=333673 RepID=A0A3M0L101_HIRRU|nr:hypothetical protein DUI87_03827 [Hirundo rustica rustica]